MCLGHSLPCCIQKWDKDFFCLFLAMQAKSILLESLFPCNSGGDGVFAFFGRSCWRTAVRVISPRLRSQPPNTFPGFFQGPQMHFKSPWGHLTGGPAPPTPPTPDKFPTPTPCLPVLPKWRQMGTFTPPTPATTPYLTVLPHKADPLPSAWASPSRDCLLFFFNGEA